MEIGIGLPNAVPETSGEQLTEFARRAESRGFSSLGTIDRVVYPNYEPLTALAAAAAVTERIRLATTILIAPLRANAALLAKQAASVHALSGGRLVLGLGIGGREDDYEGSGLSVESRGARLADQIEEMKRIWSGEQRGYAGPIGPPSPDGPPQLIIGGMVDAALRRAARLGDGWIMGGGAPDQFSDLAGKFREAWSEQGRDGEPRTMALAYFALGAEGEQHADRYLHHYYGWLGETADAIAASAATDEETVRQYVSAFEAAGCGELILFPCSGEPDQVDLLADAAGK